MNESYIQYLKRQEQFLKDKYSQEKIDFEKSQKKLDDEIGQIIDEIAKYN